MAAFCASGGRLGALTAAGPLGGVWARRAEVGRRRARYSVGLAPTMIRGFPNNFEGSSGGSGSGSGGNERKSTAFDSLSYPCVFTFKVIGIRQGDFMNEMQHAAANALGTELANVKMTSIDKGKWRSVTLRATVASPEQIYACYAAFDRDPRVKFKF